MTPRQEDLDALAAARNLPGWEVLEYRPGGALEGFVVIKGTELHCHFFAGMPLRRKSMRAFLAPLLERHGHLTTRVAHDDTANQRLNRAFGFERTWSDAQFHYFILTELPFGKGAACL